MKRTYSKDTPYFFDHTGVVIIPGLYKIRNEKQNYQNQFVLLISELANGLSYIFFT